MIMAIEKAGSNSRDGSEPQLNPSTRMRSLFTHSGGWNTKQEAIEMGFELLFAERDELIDYVKALKTLAVYITGRTKIRSENLINGYFVSAEKNFPEHMRREMSVGIEE
jgi:ribosomal protein S18